MEAIWYGNKMKVGVLGGGQLGMEQLSLFRS
jgi:hypothetical protein